MDDEEQIRKRKQSPSTTPPPTEKRTRVGDNAVEAPAAAATPQPPPPPEPAAPPSDPDGPDPLPAEEEPMNIFERLMADAPNARILAPLLATTTSPPESVEDIYEPLSRDSMAGDLPSAPIRLQTYVHDEEDAKFVAPDEFDVNGDPVEPDGVDGGDRGDDSDDTGAVQETNILPSGSRRSRAPRLFAFEMRPPPDDTELEELDSSDLSEDGSDDSPERGSMESSIINFYDRRAEAHDRAVEEADQDYVPQDGGELCESSDDEFSSDEGDEVGEEEEEAGEEAGESESHSVDTEEDEDYTPESNTSGTEESEGDLGSGREEEK